MNNCIFCGQDSGFSMFCKDCIEAFMYYRTKYFIEKDNRPYEEMIFSSIYDTLEIDKYLEEYPLERVEELTQEIREKMTESAHALNESQVEKFIKYMEDRLIKRIKGEEQ